MINLAENQNCASAPATPAHGAPTFAPLTPELAEYAAKHPTIANEQHTGQSAEPAAAMPAAGGAFAIATTAALMMTPEQRIESARKGIFINMPDLLQYGSTLSRRKKIDDRNTGLALRSLVRGEKIASTAGYDAAYFCLGVADRLGGKYPDGRLDSFETILRPGLEANEINIAAFLERLAGAQAKAVKREEKDRQKSELRRAAGLAEDESGKVKNCLSNTLQILRTCPEWKGRIRYDDLGCRPVLEDGAPIDAEPGDWTDTHTTLLRAHAEITERILRRTRLQIV